MNILKSIFISTFFLLIIPLSALAVGDTTAPSINIKYPYEGEMVTGMVRIGGTASDDVALDRLELFIDNDFLPYATASASPYEMTWYSDAYANGNYLLIVKAYDTSGNEASDSATVTKYSFDITPPSVAIWSPNEIEPVVGTINIEVGATDNIGMQKVEVFLDDRSNLIGSQFSVGPSYSISWDSATATQGTHILIADAYDTSGNVSSYYSLVNVVYPDNENPDIWIISPVEGQTVSGVINFEADATDNNVMQEVEFFINDQSLGIDFVAPYSVSLDTTNYTDGNYVLKGIARDAFYNSDEDQITINIDNIDDIAPTVNILSPVDGSTVKKKTTVNIVVQAYDNIAVSKVDFYINGKLTCSKTSNYTCSFKSGTNVGLVYVIEAKATDTSGNVASDFSTIRIVR